FAFVIPGALLDRTYFDGFRKGWYSDPVEPVSVQFTDSWDFRRIRPHPFPRSAGVVFGRRGKIDERRPLDSTTLSWSGRLPFKANAWRAVRAHITQERTTRIVTG